MRFLLCASLLFKDSYTILQLLRGEDRCAVCVCVSICSCSLMYHLFVGFLHALRVHTYLHGNYGCVRGQREWDRIKVRVV